MKVTYFGHSCFCVEIKGKKLLFDPFISANPLASAIAIKEIEADYIIISHAHEDHIADALSIATRTGAAIIATVEITKYFKINGINNLIAMNIGGSHLLDFCKIKLVNAVHSSSFSDGTYGGNPAGFYITSTEGNFYYSGDTALHHDMKMLGKYHRVNFAFLCMGGHFTMDVEDALIASKFIKCDKIIGMHFNTFPQIMIDASKAIELFFAADKELILMDIGSTISI